MAKSPTAGVAGGSADFVVVANDALGEAMPELERGFDPVETPIAWALFGQLLAQRPAPIGQFLRDQSTMVGIGDVYADEILYQAGLRHDRLSPTLSSQEVRRLYRAVVEVLHDAIKARGATRPEWSDLYGKPGHYELQVYGREGQRTNLGRYPVQKAPFEGRFTYYCNTQV